MRRLMKVRWPGRLALFFKTFQAQKVTTVTSLSQLANPAASQQVIAISLRLSNESFTITYK
jgi:hypothetical protein